MLKKIFLIFGFYLLAVSAVFGQDDVIKIKNQDVAGEFFGVQVPRDNYQFAKAAVLIFGSKWGAEPKTPEELEDRVWEDLLLSYESFRRNVVVDQKEVDEEVAKLLESEKVTFDWKKDLDAFDKWSMERLKEPAGVFQNQIKHLLQLQKLRTQIIDSIVPTVTEAESYQEYLDQYNTLSLELVQFDDIKAADEFYRKMKNPRAWVKKFKKDPKFAQRPGFVSAQFLMDIWGISREAIYAMLELPVGSVYKPAKVYTGFGVFHTLDKRVADKGEFEKSKQQYFDRVRKKKQFDGFGDWLKAFRKDAKIKVFIQ